MLDEWRTRQRAHHLKPVYVGHIYVGEYHIDIAVGCNHAECVHAVGESPGQLKKRSLLHIAAQLFERDRLVINYYCQEFHVRVL